MVERTRKLAKPPAAKPLAAKPPAAKAVTFPRGESGDQASLVAKRIASFSKKNGDNLRAAPTMYGQIYGIIREALLSGVLAAGDLLSIRALATALGTSGMPVREALGRLMVEGGLESLPSRAYRVPSVTIDQFRELTLMRLRLEALATEHAAVRIKPSDLIRLGAELDFMSNVIRTSQLDYLQAHRRFHFLIYEISSMPLLCNSIETLWLRMGPLMGPLLASADLDEEISFHKQLYFAMERSDPTACYQALEIDLTRAARRATAYMVSLEAGTKGT